MADKKIVYTDNDRAIVSMLKNANDGLTIAEMNEGREVKLAPGSFTSAVRKGLIEVIGEREITRQAKRQIGTYSFVDCDVHSNEAGKAYNYTEKELALLKVASTLENPFTLADLANAMGVERLSSGSINGLVKKGNISKGDKITVVVPTKATVNVYGFVADVPQD